MLFYFQMKFICNLHIYRCHQVLTFDHIKVAITFLDASAIHNLSIKRLGQ